MAAIDRNHSQHTATIETLTASVRVLMVGSRQVTLSVFRQLDVVPFDDVVPFGRVNAVAGEKFIVGQHKITGELVSALVSFPAARLDFDDRVRLNALLAEGQEYAYQRGEASPEYETLREIESEEIDARKRYHAALDTYKGLPLIVLAGLK